LTSILFAFLEKTAFKVEKAKIFVIFSPYLADSRIKKSARILFSYQIILLP